MESWLDLNTVNLLGRVDSRIHKQHLVKRVALAFGLGKVKRFVQIKEGFEDYNVRLVTSRGTYLVKVFSQYKSFRHVKDNVLGLLAFEKAGVWVPKLKAQTNGEYLYLYETKEAIALVCVMEYFGGKSFWRYGKEPSEAEVAALTKQMALIHGVKYKPKGVYDVWSVRYLGSEYEKKRQFLGKHDRERVGHYAEWIEQVKTAGLTKATIHGDLQRSNVLRNTKGEIRIVDFSVMDDYWVAAELAVFVALFVWNPDQMNEREAWREYELVVETYEKERRLTATDKQVLPKLIGATYAINCLAATYELRGKENESEESRYWMELGSKGMKLVESVF